jgi:hypothetical protein
MTRADQSSKGTLMAALFRLLPSASHDERLSGTRRGSGTGLHRQVRTLLVTTTAGLQIPAPTSLPLTCRGSVFRTSESAY